MTFTDYDGTAYPIDLVRECVTAQIEAADSGDPSPVMDDAVSTARFLLQAIKRIRELDGAVELLRKLKPWEPLEGCSACPFCGVPLCGSANPSAPPICADRKRALRLTAP